MLPGMRKRRAGVIVNVSSSTTLAPMPLLSIYCASKAAVNALTEVAALELAEFGIRARVVVPGASPETDFGKKGRARIMAEGGFPDAYADFAKRTMAAMQQHSAGGAVTKAEDVAKAIFRAATDPDCPMILPAGSRSTETTELSTWLAGAAQGLPSVDAVEFCRRKTQRLPYRVPHSVVIKHITVPWDRTPDQNSPI